MRLTNFPVFFLKRGFLCFVFTLFSFSPPAIAQIEEEMKVLRLFYKEEELVVSPTRYPKPISQAAENISIITAPEIEAMNAHTLAEVLKMIPGLFINFGGEDFGSSALLGIQGSEDKHVLVLLDGITWNFLSSGGAETNSIPVQIIERIEIIKGPASSAWGSSLGGVINIITREAGESERPRGFLSSASGEKDTQDYRAQLSGKRGSLGYYLFVGRQKSDGLKTSRYFEKNSLYSKFNLEISEAGNLGLTLGYSEPHLGFGDLPSRDMTSTGLYRTFFSTLSWERSLSEEFGLEFSLHTFKQKFVQRNNSLSTGILFLDAVYDEETRGGTGRLIWKPKRHTIIFGVDIDYAELVQTLQLPLAAKSVDPKLDRWAIYLNDTLLLGRWSITPGVRFDHNNLSGPFTSPNLGITYRIDQETIVRAIVSRGFTLPPLSASSGGALFFEANSALKAEEVWSYQLGVESNLIKYLWVKSTIFYHDLRKALKDDELIPSALYRVINKGKTERQGLELELETERFYQLSLKTSASYVEIKPSREGKTRKVYTSDFILNYTPLKSLRLQLSGHYIWWDLQAENRANYKDFISDFNLRQRLYQAEKTSAEVFFTVHNLFNGSQYTFKDYINPRRWAEVGVRTRF